MDTIVFPGLSLPSEPLPLSAVGRRFDQVAGGVQPRVTIEGRYFLHLPAETLWLTQVRDMLRMHLVPPEDDDNIWAYLIVRTFTDDEDASVVCAGMALPALTVLSQHLAHRCGDSDRAAQTAILTGFLTEIGVTDLDEPFLFRRVIRETWRSGLDSAGLLTPDSDLTVPVTTNPDLLDIENLDVADGDDGDDLLADHGADPFGWDDDQPWGEIPDLDQTDIANPMRNKPGERPAAQPGSDEPASGDRPPRPATHRHRSRTRRNGKSGNAARRWAWLFGPLLAVLWLAGAGAAQADPVLADSVQTVALAGSLEQVLNNVTKWIMGILTAAATVFLTISGARFVMAGGDPGEIEKAKAAFRNACYGYATAALAPVIVGVLKQIVGA